MCWEMLGNSAREGYPTSEDGEGFRAEERGIETAGKSRISSNILSHCICQLCLLNSTRRSYVQKLGDTFGSFTIRYFAGSGL